MTGTSEWPVLNCDCLTSLGFDNLLGWLRELRKTLYSLLLIYFKEFRDSQMEDRHRARYVEMGTDLPCPLRVHLSWYLNVFTNPKAPWTSPVHTFYRSFITQAWLINSPAIGNLLRLQLPSPYGDGESGARCSNPVITQFVPPATTRANP